MRVRYLAFVAALFCGAYAAPAQSPSDHVALGDQAHASLHPAEALAHYRKAIAADSNDYVALWKAAREAVDLAEFDPDEDARAKLYQQAEADARRAVGVNPGDPEGHFHLARALGRVALSLGPKERVKYAKEVRDEALVALDLDPHHAGALHVMGRWNAEVMRLSGLTRFMAKQFLGAKVFGTASWKEAVRYMEESVREDPARLVHHLDLGEIYMDTDDTAKAREQLELVVNGAATEYNDRFYKEQAKKDLAKLK